ncbi:hypothetical protein Ciccas_007354 [Cichlidogyrus casuarinus]|uniref:Uncharacterized protein n=1 Tax=Cichlidogyrus casuarinus TaxID=1844966 RepID=A0ABD2Q348_9PLAT
MLYEQDRDEVEAMDTDPPVTPVTDPIPNVWERLMKKHRKSVAPSKGLIRSVHLPNSQSCSTLAQETTLTSQQQPARSDSNIYSSLNLQLEATYVAEGHTKPVLDLDISGHLCLTASADRTAKLWDLNALTETLTIRGHTNSVNKAKFHPEDPNMLFTVCAFFACMWDMRELQKPVHVLSSRGTSSSRMPELSSFMNIRQNVCPPGESIISDISLNGNQLLMAAATTVRLWDMRRPSALGFLSGHQGAVTVLHGQQSESDLLLATGSKDHTVRLFELNPYSCGCLSPVLELEPPHYDGVEAVVLDRENRLFSSSRDGMLKAWQLSREGGLTATPLFSLHKAHKDSSQLAMAETFLVSGCRSGCLKVWNAAAEVEDASRLICEQHLVSPTGKDNGINALETSGTRLFTAHNDATAKFWQIKGL